MPEATGFSGSPSIYTRCAASIAKEFQNAILESTLKNISALRERFCFG